MTVRTSPALVTVMVAAPDTRLPIGYALAYPARLPQGNGSLDTLAALGAPAAAPSLRYDFEPPDPQRFPCVTLAYSALERGGTMPVLCVIPSPTTHPG